MFDVREHSSKGLVGAIWYWDELVVEYETHAQRHKAFHRLSRRSQILNKEDINPIGSGKPREPRRYMSWVLPYYRRDTPTILSQAIHQHFDGTGYSSYYTFGHFEGSRDTLRIIFHKAPPALTSTLNWNSRERWFRREIVSADDYPLQEEHPVHERGSKFPTLKPNNPRASGRKERSEGSAAEASYAELVDPLHKKHAPSANGIIQRSVIQEGNASKGGVLDGSPSETSKSEETPARESPVKHALAPSNMPGAASEDYWRTRGRVGRVISTPLRDPTYIAKPMTEAQLAMLKSENRFVSIPFAFNSSGEEELRAAMTDIYDAVERYGGDGLVGALWYGTSELVVEYSQTSQRDKAFLGVSETCLGWAKDIRALGPGGPELCMSWIIPFQPEDSPTALAEALQKHFRGTGYSSSYMYGRFDLLEGLLRIVFHKPPPPLGNILLWPGSSHMRELQEEVVIKDYYPLHTEQQYDEDRDTLDEEPRAQSDLADIAHKGNGSVTRASAKVSAAVGTDRDRDGIRDWHENATKKRNRPFEQGVKADQAPGQQYLATVSVDEMSYFIPTAVTLPLDDATFDTFARLYFDVIYFDFRTSDAFNTKLLIRLYRSFLETQFLNASNEAIMDALQRVS